MGQAIRVVYYVRWRRTRESKKGSNVEQDAKKSRELSSPALALSHYLNIYTYYYYGTLVLLRIEDTENDPCNHHPKANRWNDQPPRSLLVLGTQYFGTARPPHRHGVIKRRRPRVQSQQWRKNKTCVQDTTGYLVLSFPIVGKSMNRNRPVVFQTWCFRERDRIRLLLPSKKQ